ncbi:hypothetical protein D3C73_603680 [compost metagenome]
MINKSVDLPAPGGAVITLTLSLTIPPPITRSNSGMPMIIRGSFEAVISLSRLGFSFLVAESR